MRRTVLSAVTLACTAVLVIGWTVPGAAWQALVMETPYWPLYGLRITTPRLELRLPDTALLDELAAVAADGVHDSGFMPFLFPWSDGGPEQRGRNTLQHLLGTIAEWRPERWTLSLAVLCDGKAVGRQDVVTSDFAVTREAETGSWLGRAHQGQGIGTEMREAVLRFAFEALGARSMTSAAMTDNARSLAVSRKLGYRPDGCVTASVRGRARTVQRLRLDRTDWERRARALPVEVTGLEPCRALLGLDGAAEAAAEAAEETAEATEAAAEAAERTDPPGTATGTASGTASAREAWRDAAR